MIAPHKTGCMTPRLSIHQPMAMPPTPLPIISHANAIDGPARGHPKSAAICFKLTNKMVVGTMAIVPSASEAAITIQPYRISMLSARWFMWSG